MFNNSLFAFTNTSSVLFFTYTLLFIISGDSTATISISLCKHFSIIHFNRSRLLGLQNTALNTASYLAV